MITDNDLRDAMAKALHRASYESGHRLYSDNLWDLADEFERERWRLIADAGIRVIKDTARVLIEDALDARRSEWFHMGGYEPGDNWVDDEKLLDIIMTALDSRTVPKK